MRRKDSPTLMLTGATGFLGSHLALALLDRGYDLILPCRPNTELNAWERIAQRLAWFGYDINTNPRCRIIEAHLEKEKLGLDDNEYDALAVSVDQIIHCAAETSFAERNRPKVEAANILSLRNVLGLAKACGCSLFHLVSTAYVAGTRQGPCHEDLTEPPGFHNVYEESKHAAEREAFDTCREAGIRLNIFRPSIVFGNSRDGRSFRFNALYYPMRLIDYLRGLFLRDIRDNGGHHTLSMGVRCGKNGRLSLPVRIEYGSDESLNVVPIDYFVVAALTLIQESREGGIYHIVNPEPVPMPRIIEYARRFFDIEGIRPVPHGEYVKDPPGPLETLVKRQLSAYLPYMRDRRQFLQENASAKLEPQGIRCPPFDYAYFERCIRWAIKENWGREWAVS